MSTNGGMSLIANSNDSMSANMIVNMNISLCVNSISEN